MGKPSFIAESLEGSIPINWYPVPDDQRGVILARTPGLITRISTSGWYLTHPGITPTNVLAIKAVDSNTILVLWRCNQFSTAIAIGDVPASAVLIEYDSSLTETGQIWQLRVDPSVSNCQIEYCASDYIVCDGTTLWSLKRETPWTANIQSFNASSIATADGYCIASVKDSGQFRISGLNDFFTWDDLDYGTAEGDIDKTLRIVTDHRELWVFGEKTTEIYYNSGAADFPYARSAGGYMEHGIAAWASAAKMDNNIYWLSHRRQILRATGYQPQIVSTRKIDKIIQKMSIVSDAIGFSMVFNGHSFYWITFPTEERTFVFDSSTNLWHERAYWDSNYRGGFISHLAGCYEFFNGIHLVGDSPGMSLLLGGHTPKVCELTDDAIYDNYNQIHRKIDFPAIFDNNSRNRLFHSRVEVELSFNDVDVDWMGGDVDKDATYQLSWSDDGGETWSDPRISESVQFGEHDKRVIFRRLGSSRKRTYRFTTANERVEAILGIYPISTPGQS